jgi:uncharacterized phage protein (TIGR02220 family)
VPTRYLKPGICDSEKIDRIQSPIAENLYYRLLTNVDDFGRMDARPSVVRSKCFPLRENLTSDTVLTWMHDLAQAGLIILYVVDGKPYLQFTGWDNKPRADESKCPPVPADADKCMQIPTVLPVTVTVTGTKTETDSLSGKPDPAIQKLNGKAQFIPEAMDVLEYLNRATGKGFEFKNRSGELTASAEKIIQRLKQGYTAVELREVVHAKCSQWAADDKMAEYLRPTTLFGREKFEQYIGELKGGA